MKNIQTILCAFLVILASTHASLAQLTPTYNDISIPMSDGKSLEADVYIPAGTDSGQVILIQTPYNKNKFSFNLPLGVQQNLDAQPYIFVIVDWRGFYGSSGAAVSDPDRGQDAYDVCEWIVAQSWHKDRIGTWGPSALGQIQYSLISKQHPSHTCAVPQVATGYQGYEAYFYGGVLEEARLNQLDALGYGLSTLVLANVYDSFVWGYADTSSWHADEIRIPTLQIGGWYDHNIDKMMDFYKDSRTLTTASIQDKQWLLIGPWVHGGTGAAYLGSSVQGELSYPSAEYKSDSMALDFFDFYLLDSANNWESTSNITYFDMGGSDDWLTTNQSEIAESVSSVLYLTQNNGLINTKGTGTSSFVSDPDNPSPTLGGATLSTSLDQGPYDQSSLDSRSDIVTFSTGPLEQDASVTGRIQLDLYVSADVKDCDIAVRLVDVYPTGENMLITDGIKRMRFRNNAYKESDEVFMTSGEVYNVQVDLPFLRYTWKQGHALKVYISGNHSIRFNVNLQNGGAMYDDQGTPQIGNINIHHNTDYPSQIVLPGNAPVLGLNEQINGSSTAKSLRIYPNPVAETLFWNTGTKRIQHVTITSTEGRLITKMELLPAGKNHGKVDLTSLNLPRGMYFFHVEYRNGTKEFEKFTVK